jgi:hypothetical protein
MIDLLQAEQNDGRGVACVRSLLTYARRADFQQAVRTFFSEQDKIRQYPDLETLIAEVFGLEKVSVQESAFLVGTWKFPLWA